MALLEESKGICTAHYKHTQVKTGYYYLMPDALKPAFLVPAYQRKAFRTAIGLIKPITRKGDLKKKLIALAPRWILNFVFKRVYISNPNEGGKHALILPWNQNRSAKTTIISFDLALKNVEVEKYAFQDFTKQMVRNEKAYLNQLKGDSEAKIIVPEVKDFRETEDYTLLVQDFYFGEYVEEINTNILSFFDKLNSTNIYPLHEHPYLISKWPT
ncbi:MAG: hypothetical protein ACPGED_09240, partial [Flavobacteriales bacterium]